MRAVTIAVLGTDGARDLASRLGKGKPEGDVARFHYKKDDAAVNLVVPAKYPDRVQGVSQCLLISDRVILVAERLDRDLGLLVLAANAAGLPGEILVAGDLQPETLRPLTAGTRLADWSITTLPDVAVLRERLLDLPPGGQPGATRVHVEQAFPVRGVGTVVLGAVTHGTVDKNQELAAFPSGATCSVRSIQVHDDDVARAPGGSRVGLALRGVEPEALGRGTILAPTGSLRSVKTGETLTANIEVPKFFASGIETNRVFHAGVGLQVAPMRVTEGAAKAGTSGTIRLTVETGVVASPGDPILLWDLDNTGLRFAAGGRIE